jgi:ABC-type dipeptide/oligopeptide/nickel transport system permease subunit
LGGLFAGFWFVTMLDFLGLGIRPPNPTLGGMMMDGVRMLTVRPETMLAPGIALWVCAFAFYTAADALVGFFHSKEPLARLME